MERDNRKSEVGRMVLSKALSPEGRDWFMLAMDPFHDYPHPVAGYPDSDGSHTVVSCFQYALDVVAPPGVVANWDCHVFNGPVTHRHELTQFSAVGNTHANFNVTGAVLAKIQSAPLTVISAAAGEDLFQRGNAPWAPLNSQQQYIDMADDAGAGISRVIGFGYEIVNTTPEMFKSGTITCYRMPQEGATDNNLYTNNAQTNGAVRTVKCYRSPPPKASDCLVLGGTRSWAASEGAYVAVPLSNVANPLTSAQNVGVHYSADGFDDVNSNVLADADTYLTVPNNMPQLTAGLVPSRKFIPFTTTGVFLTGLTPQTSLRVKVKVFVERAPTYSETALAVLATPSAPYDAKVLALYSACVSKLPPAVPVGYNAAGDWWRMILRTVSAVAVPIGTIIGGPGGAAIGGIVAGSAGLIADTIPDKLKANERKAVDQIQSGLNNLKLIEGAKGAKGKAKYAVKVRGRNPQAPGNNNARKK